MTKHPNPVDTQNVKASLPLPQTELALKHPTVVLAGDLAVCGTCNPQHFNYPAQIITRQTVINWPDNGIYFTAELHRVYGIPPQDITQVVLVGPYTYIWALAKNEHGQVLLTEQNGEMVEIEKEVMRFPLHQNLLMETTKNQLRELILRELIDLREPIDQNPSLEGNTK